MGRITRNQGEGTRRSPGPTFRCAAFRSGLGGPTVAQEKTAENLPQRAMFSAKDVKGTPQKRDAPVSGKPKSKGPWWSPRNAYWLIDDVVYTGVEKAYQGINWVAKKAGRKEGFGKEAVGVGTYLGGICLNAAYRIAQTPGSALNHLVELAVCSSLAIPIAIRLKRENGKCNGLQSGVISMEKMFLKVVRLPIAVLAVAMIALRWSETSLPKMQLEEIPMAIGGTMFLYLLTGENGMWNRAKDAVNALMETVRAGLAQKKPVCVKDK